MLPLYNNEDVAKNFQKLKIQGKVEKGSVIGWIVIFISLVMARNAGYVKQVVTDIASIISTGIVMLGIGGRHIEDRNDPYIRRLALDIKRTVGYDFHIESLKDIEIIPRNIQIGEDLSAKNIVPIFKEGHYIVVKSRPWSFILRQVEVYDRDEVQILEPEEAWEVIDDLAVNNEFVRNNIKVLKRSI